MVFKLAWRNIISKPWRAVATVFAIAIAIAMIFCMFSFEQSVYEYIYATETADAGSSDIIVTYNSSSDRIFNVEPLNAVEGIDEISPSLSLFALLDDEYIKVRGFEPEKIDILHDIKLVDGSIENWKSKPDSIVISKSASEHFGLSVDDAISLSLGTSEARFYVEGISEDTGYFLNNAPFVFIGNCEQGVSRLLGLQTSVYNEIYVTAKNGVSLDSVIDSISDIPEYEGMRVEVSKDNEYIKQMAINMSAPIVLAGGAVVLLSLASIVILFVLSEREKRTYIARLSVVGATKKQMIVIFLTESVLLAFIGAVLGSLIASGIFIALLKLTLSSTVMFSVSFSKLFGSAAVGVIAAIGASILPLIKAFKGSIRENELSSNKKSILSKVLPIALLVTTIITIVIECTVAGTKGILSVVNTFLVLFCIGVWAQKILKGASYISEKAKSPAVKVASFSLRRERRFARSTTMLTTGMTVSMILFMAWSITTSVFDSYLSEINNMIFISNIQESIDETVFEIDGVDSSNKTVWRTVDIASKDIEKTVNLIGTKNAFEVFDFEFITTEDTVRSRLQSVEPRETPWVFIDIAYSELYGYKVGDILDVTIEGQKKSFEIGGILSQKIFSGQYVVMSEDVIKESFGIGIDTIILKTSGNMNDIVGTLRTDYADKNYYVLSARDVYKWSSESTLAIFDLVGTLAGVITILIFLATVSSVVVSRGTALHDRRALLMSGMSKNTLLKTELFEHSLTAILAYIVSFAVSVLLTMLLINALRLFNLYYEFMYEAWVVALVGAIMAIVYAILPLVLNFKRGYNTRRQ